MMFFLILLLLYFLTVYLEARFITPYYGFRKGRLPATIPDDFLAVINDLNKKSKTNEEYLRNCYEYLIHRFHGSRLRAIVRYRYSFDRVFAHASGYIPCHIHNLLLRIMLVRSGRFSDDDIRTQVVFLNFFTHQYLKVRIDGHWIAVDPNSAHMGVPFGERAIGIR